MATEPLPPAETPAAPAPAAEPAAPVSLKAKFEAVKAKAAAEPDAPPAEPVAAAADAPPAAEAAKPPEPPKEKTGAALAKLAAEQRKAREEVQRLKAAREESERSIKAQKAALEKEIAELKAWQDAKAQAKRHPLKALEMLGVTGQMVNESLLNEGQPTPSLEVEQLRDEMARLKEAQDAEFKRLAEEKKQAADERAKEIAAQEAEVLKNFQAQCAAFVDQNAEKYELTASLGAQSLVFQTIDEVYRMSAAEGTPRVLSIEDAAEQVEKALEERIEQATKTKKFTARQQAQAPKAPATPAPKAAKSPAQTKTLSNNATAPGSSNGAQSESWRERRARVYAKLS